MPAALLIALLCLGGLGCASHKKVQAFVMPPFTPVELSQIPPPEEPTMVEADEDEDDLPPVPVAEGASSPKRQRRRPVKPAVAATVSDVPVTSAVAATPEATEAANAVGEFTPGGDQNPKTQKEAADLLAANERRLGSLSAEQVRTQASLVSNVKNFQRQAQQALKAGDAEGAKTLATKGKLLLDDLEKAAGS